VFATVHVGERPQAIAVDTRANLIFTANTHGNNVSIIDGSANALIATVNAGKNPYAIAVDPDSGKAFVANMSGPNFTMIDAKAHSRTH
jgi:YVTN family beta-propeller protein